MIGALAGLVKQLPVNCVTEMTCFPNIASNPLSVFTFFEKFYGMPDGTTLALLLGIICAGIFASSPKMVTLAILGIYVTAAGSTIWLNDVYIEPQYHAVTALVAAAVGSLLFIAVLKTMKE